MATAILKLVETPVGTLPENVVAATPRMPLPAAAAIAPIKPKSAWASWIEAAFSRSGRFSVIIRTSPLRSVNIVS